jgi:hypothetical protein
MHHQLEIADVQGRRWRVPLNRTRLLIGREATCDIHLPHPNVSRRHAQLQLTDQGRWLLQDLSSLNHIYVEEKDSSLSSSALAAGARKAPSGWRMVEHLVMEPDVAVRIAEFRLTLKEVTAGDGAGGKDDTENWTGLEPGWLEQLHSFQRALLRLDDAHGVLESLAAEFHRAAHAKAAARTRAGAGGQMVADFHRRNFRLGAEDLCQGLLSEVSAEAGHVGDDQTVLALRSL